MKGRQLTRLVRALLMVAVCAGGLASCEPPQVYGSIGYSSYSGSYYGGGYGGSISVGGRIL